MSKHKKAPRIDPLDCALPAGGIDTHAHMNDPAFDEDRDEVLKRAAQCGLSHVANVFLNPETFPADAGLFRDHPEVFFLLGVHPDDARPFCQDTLDLIRTRIRECPRIRAVGEIGLDYSRPDPECTPHDVQKAAFTAQLRLAAELDMPVSIHCRDAQEDTLSILESEGFAGRPLVWHCFGGGPELIRPGRTRDMHQHPSSSAAYSTRDIPRDVCVVSGSPCSHARDGLPTSCCAPPTCRQSMNRHPYDVPSPPPE